MARLVFALIVILSATGCIKDEVTSSGNCDMEKVRTENLAKRTISEGICGTVGLAVGDCMSVTGAGRVPCLHCPVKRTVQVYEYTNIALAVRSTTPPYYFDHFTTQKLAETEADERGFYEITIGPGKYTIVTIEEGKIYVGAVDPLGGINPVIVESNVARRVNLTVSKAGF